MTTRDFTPDDESPFDAGPIEKLHDTSPVKRILDMLNAGVSHRRIIDIGHHHRTWTPADVDRVIEHHILGTYPDPAQLQPPGWTHNRPRPDGTPAPRVELTQRQADVLHLMCQGFDNATITARLGVHPDTLRAHIRTIAVAMNVKSRPQVVLHAQYGWVRLYLTNRAARAAA